MADRLAVVLPTEAGAALRERAWAEHRTVSDLLREELLMASLQRWREARHG